MTRMAFWGHSQFRSYALQKSSPRNFIGARIDTSQHDFTKSFGQLLEKISSVKYTYAFQITSRCLENLTEHTGQLDNWARLIEVYPSLTTTAW